MTDDVEQELARMLRNRVADLPASHEVAPATVARVHRRRAVKLGAFTTAVLVVIAGTAAAVARTRPDDSHRLTTAGPTSTTTPRGSVTVDCPITGSPVATDSQPTVAPATATPRVPDTRNASSSARFSSFAAFDDVSHVVLGPSDWSCLARLGQHGQDATLVVYAPPPDGGVPTAADAPIAIENNTLGSGNQIGSALACAVSAASGKAVLCVGVRGLRVHAVDANVATFVDADGARGAGQLVMSSSPGATDGSMSVLTCRPTRGLTADDCDTIIADWVARVRAASPTTTTITTTPAAPPGTVPTTACPVSYALTQYQPLPSPTTAPRTVTIPGAGAFVSYAATTDDRYVVLGPKGWHCSAAVGADGDNGMDVTPNSSPGASNAAISIINDYLWHGFVGVGEACNVFTKPELASQASGGPPCALPPGRTVTRCRLAHLDVPGC